MIALIQRVTRASVSVAGETLASIGPGLVVLAAVQARDGPAEAQRLADRVLNYRVFSDVDGRMNVSVLDCDGGVLWIPQFTLAADTCRGRRPSFATAAPPEQAKELFEALVDAARHLHPTSAVGRFGADMQVELINDGPVTFWLES